MRVVRTKEQHSEVIARPTSSTNVASFDSDSLSIDFSVGNQRVEHITGVIHLYKKSTIPDGGELVSDQLCVLAVPQHLGVQEFCSLCGPHLKLIKEMRFLRREQSRETVFMVYLRFIDNESAQCFFQEKNGQPFCSFEQDVVWTLLFVESLEFLDGPNATTGLLESGETELPTCPVCLERLDENISGIVTTVCNHLFHNECLMKCGHTSCPVCRHCMQGVSQSKCSQCDACEDLWICLICGHVGCGRYKSQHAVDHWKETQHCYALELDSGRVWDYVSDGYVHRLVQSKTDGKIVEVQGNGESSHRPGESSEGSSKVDYQHEEAIVASKIDQVVYEYNQLLTTQLESQRLYFEDILCRNRLEADEKLRSSHESMTATSRALDASRTELKEMTKAKKNAQKKTSELNERLQKAQDEKEFLRQLNETLILNQREWKVKTEKLEQEMETSKTEKDSKIKELEEQVRDLMVFIEAQKTVGESELQGGSVIIQEQTEQQVKPARRRRGRH
eukprot:g1422.t1